MTDINCRFDQAATAVKRLSARPENDTLLPLYALFKQVSSGDVCGDKPGFFDVVATAGYAAWERLKAPGRDDARQQYMDLVIKLGAPIDD